MKWKLVLLTLLSAVLFPLALPNELFPDGNPIIGLLCLSFFFWALYESPSYKFASLLGAVFGLLTTVLANYWLKNYNEFAIYTLGGTTLGYIGLNALLAPIIRGFSHIKPAMRPFLTAMLFTVYEYLKSTGFLGFPYALIAHPVHAIIPFIQFVDVTGLWGLSFLCAYINALLAETFYLRYTFGAREIATLRYRSKLMIRYKGLFAIALIAIAFSYGGLRLAVGFSHEKSLDVLLIQQNIDPWDAGKALTGLTAAREETLEGVKEAVKQNKRVPDLIVWSETALRYAVDPGADYSFQESSFFSRYFPNLFTEFGTTTLSGAPVVSEERGRYYNAAILVTRDGRITRDENGQPEFYAKQHPVPFVESIPFMEIGFIRDFFEGQLGLSDFWLMGRRSNALKVDLEDGSSVALGVPICFEDVFPDVCRDLVRNGAELLVNITNDSWSEMRSALTQHTAAARFRSIETRKVMLRSCNAGLTCVISPTGEITDSLPLFTRDHLLVTVPIEGVNVTTLYLVLGDYLPYLFTAFLMALLILNAFQTQFARLEIIIRRRFTGK